MIATIPRKTKYPRVNKIPDFIAMYGKEKRPTPIMVPERTEKAYMDFFLFAFMARNKIPFGNLN